jgi:hypothetical protein
MINVKTLGFPPRRGANRGHRRFAEPRTPLLRVVGAGRRELAASFDAIIWVQSDLDETLARDQQRVAAGKISPPVAVAGGWRGVAEGDGHIGAAIASKRRRAR